MNAAELVAAIREDHYSYKLPRKSAECWICTTPWPCPPAIAADRIETLLNVPVNTRIGDSPRAFVNRVLDGEWP